MLFNSYIFILAYLPVTLLVYFYFGHNGKYTLAKWFLFAASLFFYAYNNICYLLIICISLIINYAISCGLIICKGRINIRKAFVIMSLFVNLGLLLYFKYFDFFIENVNLLFGYSFNYLNIMLPLGISFYTFQQISYIIDVYKDEAPKYRFIDYALFITFFPQLIAGPIALHSEMIPQFQDKAIFYFSADNFAEGLYDFSVGLAKKVIIADRFGEAVHAGYLNVSSLSMAEAWIVMICYTIQIYFDFSGYCDMAQGIAKMFNLTLPVNFNSPYKSKSISEFWKRWHVTLGRFLRKYVYFPLGGNRKGRIRTYLNLMIVFGVSGIWHGANWTFILWGLLHGVLNCIDKAFQKSYEKIYGWLRCLITFLAVNIAWVLFRAENVTDAVVFLKKLVTWGGGVREEITVPFRIIGMNRLMNLICPFMISSNVTLTIECIIFIIFVLFLIFKTKNINEQQNKSTFVKAMLSSACLVISLLSFSKVSTFLYFNF